MNLQGVNNVNPKPCYHRRHLWPYFPDRSGHPVLDGRETPMTRPLAKRFINPDPANGEICRNCYLPDCYADINHLSQYCPLVIRRKLKLDTSIVITLSQEATPNRRWWFIEQAQAQAGKA